MHDIELKFESLKRSYDSGAPHFASLLDISAHCFQYLLDHADMHVLPVPTGDKSYAVFRVDDRTMSRPVLPDIFAASLEQFMVEWRVCVNAMDPQSGRVRAPSDMVDRVLYTAVASFACCFDLWKPGSRKTPGTFFEVLVGTWLSALLPQWQRGKHIKLKFDSESLSTDIVMTPPYSGTSLVFPVKVTTRERIVQPFAHQRILDSVYGVGRFVSLLVCMSETQRDKARTANEICVPGTIRLYQRHLAVLGGVFYLDPPNRYLESDVGDVLRVSTLGYLFTDHLASLVATPQLG
jgi:hypothetical protein